MRDPLTVKQATSEVFEDAVSPFSVRRWIARGVGVPKVKLPATRLGGVFLIERKDAELFKQASNNPELYQKRQRTERTEKAKRRLQEAGA